MSNSETWVTLLGPPFSILKTEKNLGCKIGYNILLKSRPNLCKALAWPTNPRPGPALQACPTKPWYILGHFIHMLSNSSLNQLACVCPDSKDFMNNSFVTFTSLLLFNLICLTTYHECDVLARWYSDGVSWHFVSVMKCRHHRRKLRKS